MLELNAFSHVSVIVSIILDENSVKLCFVLSVQKPNHFVSIGKMHSEGNNFFDLHKFWRLSLFSLI